MEANGQERMTQGDGENLEFIYHINKRRDMGIG